MLESRKREIRTSAYSLREKCKVGRYGIIDLFKDCDSLGYKLIRYPLGPTADLGFVAKKDQDIIIFTNTSIRLSREIFTLAHELGHIILHLNDTTTYVDNISTLSSKNIDIQEQEANYFAACLLMPTDEIDKFLDIEVMDSVSVMDIARIMSEFQVSFEMVLNRLEHLGKITSTERLQLDSKRNQIRTGNLLQNAGGDSRLIYPSHDAKIPYEYLEYVIYNYNHRAIPLETLEKTLAYYHLYVDDIKDKLIVHSVEEDDLDTLIGGLEE